MALGIHWEWRAFGRLPEGFKPRFEGLESCWGRQSVTDQYLWIPGLPVNIKFRDGVPTQEGLKFKRLRAVEGPLEQWEENPEDIFALPLSREAWASLAEELEPAGVVLPPYPEAAPDLAQTLGLLQKAHPSITLLEVRKHRRSNLWRNDLGAVNVEWADISHPQSIVTIGMEPWGDYGSAEAQSLLLAALAELGLNQRPVQPMNYVKAVTQWAQGKLIRD